MCVCLCVCVCVCVCVWSQFRTGLIMWVGLEIPGGTLLVSELNCRDTARATCQVCVCVCVCVCVFMCVMMCAPSCLDMCAHLPAVTQTYVLMFARVCMCVCVHICASICIHLFVCSHLPVQELECVRASIVYVCLRVCRHAWQGYIEAVGATSRNNIWCLYLSLRSVQSWAVAREHERLCT